MSDCVQILGESFGLNLARKTKKLGQRRIKVCFWYSFSVALTATLDNISHMIGSAHRDYKDNKIRITYTLF